MLQFFKSIIRSTDELSWALLEFKFSFVQVFVVPNVLLSTETKSFQCETSQAEFFIWLFSQVQAWIWWGNDEFQ